MSKRVIIMGAAGKDFHVFNTVYKSRIDYEVVCFTAAQIPNIQDRVYPSRLAGDRYADGIPIHSEDDLAGLIREYNVDEVVFAYSDVSYDFIEQCETAVQHAGAEFTLAPVNPIMIPSLKPVIAVTAVRTGCGKSQTTRYLANLLRDKGRRVAIVRHPMPYGELASQEIQKFKELEDLERHQCSIEEMEEYEPHLLNGHVVFAGVDYCRILLEAEKEADIIIWDGGNNDVPFFRPDIWICVSDPHRPGHEHHYYPGKINFERCNIILINKCDTAIPANIDTVVENAKSFNPNARVIKTNSPYKASDPGLIKDAKVLVIEDGPTVTHGEMKFGAGFLAAKDHGAREVIDPRDSAVGSIAEVYAKYPDIGLVLPAIGYGKEQIEDLQQTIKNSNCEVVVMATPVDLSRFIEVEQPIVRVTYELDEGDSPVLEEVLKDL